MCAGAVMPGPRKLVIFSLFNKIYDMSMCCHANGVSFGKGAPLKP